MSQCCGKIPTEDDLQHIRDSIVNHEPSHSEIEGVQETIRQLERAEPDLSISDSADPLKDRITKVIDKYEWWTEKGNHIKVRTDRDGQINYEIYEGPDRGVHRYYDPEHMREGQTGIQNPHDGSRRHDKN